MRRQHALRGGDTVAVIYRVFTLLATGLAAPALAASWALAAAPPAVKLELPRPIGGIAFTGGKLAYIDSKDCSVRGALSIPKLSEGLCEYHTIRVAGRSALVAGYLEVKCSDDTWIVAVGPPVKRLEERRPFCEAGGFELTGAASSGDALYYSYIEFNDDHDCRNRAGKCRPWFRLLGGAVVRVQQGKKQVLGRLPAVALLAAAPGRLAIVRAQRSLNRPHGYEPPGARPLPAIGPLEIRREDGTLLETIRLPAEAEVVAISETAVAVVTVAAGKRTLRWFGDAPGKLVLGAVSAVDLVVGDRFAVVQTEKQVLAVALASGRKTVLGPSSATEPGGLAVDGGNAYWVENARGGGRVLQAALP